MKKISCLLVLMTSLLVLGLDIVVAKSAPNAINVDAGLSSGSLNYIKSVDFRIKRTSAGEYVYCLNRHKNTYAVENFFEEKKLDSGYKYLVENGFPNKSITGDSKMDYYITQMAIWLYQDETSQYEAYLDYKYNLGTDFIINRNNSTDDPHGLIKKITTLTEGAINARGEEVTSSCSAATLKFELESNALTLKNDYYVSKSVLVKTASSYTVRFSTTVDGAYITDVYGNKKETFLPNEMFRVNVPKNSDVQDVTVRVESTKLVECSNSGFVYEYRSKVSEHQNVMPAVIYDTEEQRVEAIGTVEFNFSKDNSNTDDSSSNKEESNNNSSEKEESDDGSASSDNDNNNDSDSSDNNNSENNASNVEDSCTNSSNGDCYYDNSAGENVFIPDTAFDSPIFLGVSGALLMLLGLGFVYLNGKKKN